MYNQKTIQKTGRERGYLALNWRSQAVRWVLGICLLSGAVPVAHAAKQIQFTAEVDRNEVSLDDTVTLKLSVVSNGNESVSDPQLSAPDFEVVNEYNSITVESQYDSTAGGFSMQKRQDITKVLQPKSNLKAGTVYTISGIQVKVGGQVLKAPDIHIKGVAGGGVKGGGGGSGMNSGVQSFPPYGNPGGKIRLAPPGPQGVQGSQGVTGAEKKQAFVRAEVDKQTAYKGGQIIVSYYFYRKVKVFNIQVDKFPVLSGFLREDLEIPVMGQRLDSEEVVFNGVPYQRSLLARYAAYPLEEGNLSIDGLSLRYNYYSNPRNGVLDQDDPFFGFFQQLAPRTAAAQSEPLTVRVLPLPQEGRPKSFTGGVGDFSVATAVDKYDVHTDEAVTLTVKVEGRGNLATLQAPKPNWPDHIELYDSKGRAQTGRGGSGEKIFEYLLIPRSPGEIKIPSIEFGFFDPVKKQYYTKTTDPITLNVTGPSSEKRLGSPPQNHTAAQGQGLKDQGTSIPGFKNEDMRYLKPPQENSGGIFWQPTWRLLYWACLGTFGYLMFLVASDFIRRRKQKEKNSEDEGSGSSNQVWSRLETIAGSANQGAAWQEVTNAYEMITELLFDALESSFQIGARSLPRTELGEKLVNEHHFPQVTWERMVGILEFADLVRFASGAGGGNESSARSELSRWVEEAKAIAEGLEKNKK